VKPVVLMVGKGGNAWADRGVDDYSKRLRRWGGLEHVAVKPERFRGEVDAVKQAEGQRLLARVGPRDRLIAMDERGDDIDTDAFLELIQACRLDGTQHLIFAIGGAYGLDVTVRDQAWRTMRLSAMVLNHELARLVLVEQIYRAYATLHGVPYHH
jgi:23S rRNA (pseudouridine1915-N3)-methyltransferase